MSFSLSEYTKIDVGWGFAPDPTRGAYIAPPDSLSGFKGPRGGGRTRGRRKRGREGKGEWGRER